MEEAARKTEAEVQEDGRLGGPGVHYNAKGKIVIEAIPRNANSRFASTNRALHERGVCQRLDIPALCERAAPVSYSRNTRRAKLKALKEREAAKLVVPKLAPKYKPRQWWQPEQKNVIQQLRDAAMAGDIDMADQALAFGADVNKMYAHGVTALSIAGSRGHTDVAEFLLARGAEINIRDAFGNTALMHSIKQGNPEIAQMVMHIAPPAKADWNGEDLSQLLRPR